MSQFREILIRRPGETLRSVSGYVVAVRDCRKSAWRSLTTHVLGTTDTDEKGRYRLVVPKLIDQLSIGAAGKHDADRKWHCAYGEESVAGDHVKNAVLQFIELKDLDSNVSGMDWVLREDLPDSTRAFSR